MKNITVSVKDDVYRRARIKAAEMDTSVSRLVARYLEELGSGESEFERKKRIEAETREKIVGFSTTGNLSRDALYGRKRR